MTKRRCLAAGVVESWEESCFFEQLGVKRARKAQSEDEIRQWTRLALTPALSPTERENRCQSWCDLWPPSRCFGAGTEEEEEAEVEEDLWVMSGQISLSSSLSVISTRAVFAAKMFVEQMGLYPF
jgi:hypothetical protein